MYRSLSVLAGVALAMATGVGSAVANPYYFVRNSTSGGAADASFYVLDGDGSETLVGDWDGDGLDTRAVRNAEGIRVSPEFGAHAHELGPAFMYGRPDDELVMGDWDGDGIDSPAVRRGRTILLTNQLAGGTAQQTFDFGRPGDVLLAGDWDGDGEDTFGVRRGRTYMLSDRLEGGRADVHVDFGRPDDRTVVGDWDGDGTDSLGVRRGRTFHLSNRFAGGAADRSFPYGRPGDSVLVGDWDGDGTDTPGVRRSAVELGHSAENIQQIGADIPPGLYLGFGGDCNWQRRSGLDWEDDGQILGEYPPTARSLGSSSPMVARVKPTDGYLVWQSPDCPFERQAFPTDIPRIGDRPFEEGVYRVGIDVAPGTYAADETPCHWQRLSDFTGEPDDVIAEGTAHGGDGDRPADPPPVVTIESDDAGFLSVGCGGWTPTD